MASSGPFSIGSTIWPGTSKLIEEMGELAQVLGKLIALGGATDHWDGIDLNDRLHDEIADVQAALTFFLRINDLNEMGIEKRTLAKLRLFYEWQIEHSATEAPDGVR